MSPYPRFALLVTCVTAGAASAAIAQDPPKGQGTNQIGQHQHQPPRPGAAPGAQGTNQIGQHQQHRAASRGQGTNQIGQPSDSRPGPTSSPPAAPAATTRTWVDARGMRWMSVQRSVPYWDGRQGRWVFREVQEVKALGTNQIGQADRRRPTFGPPGAMGTNGIGGAQPSVGGFGGPGSIGPNSIGQPFDPNGASMASGAIPTATSGATRGLTPTSFQAMFAGNLGVYYAPILYSNGTFGLRITAAPLPGSPASQLPLDVGDVIFALNGQRFSSPSEVVNYTGQAAVSFVDAATGAQQSGNIILTQVATSATGFSRSAPSVPSAPSATSANRLDGYVAPESPVSASGGNQIGQPLLTSGGSRTDQPAIPQALPKPVLARNLGVYYLPVRYSDGTFGLKLSATPLAGSPASQLPLDTGDVIFGLDGGRFKDPGDVASHFDQTTIEYIDKSTNTRQTGTVNLPPQNP
jgi:hypothetical protein